MTSSFSRPGAVDLSALASASASAAGGAPGGAGVPTNGRPTWVLDVDEKSFNDVISQSTQYPVVLEFHSPRAQAERMSTVLAELTDAGQGRWVLGRIDVDAQPRLAQAVGVHGAPMVVAVLGGQMMPLFQGIQEKSEIAVLLDQMTQVAVANGMTGRAQPVGMVADESAPEAAKPTDPRFAAADAALEKGDYATAVAEFEKVLASSPADAEAIQGLAQSKLLQRSLDFNPEQIVADAKARPDDVDVQLQAADLELIGGEVAASFDRILQLIRENREPEVRERLRLRLLELFDAVGKADPNVLKARRKLSTALFA